MVADTQFQKDFSLDTEESSQSNSLETGHQTELQFFITYKVFSTCNKVVSSVTAVRHEYIRFFHRVGHRCHTTLTQAQVFSELLKH
jgi:hypothetical protein